MVSSELRDTLPEANFEKYDTHAIVVKDSLKAGAPKAVLRMTIGRAKRLICIGEPDFPTRPTVLESY